MSNRSDALQEELNAIARANNGLLKKDDVWRWAKAHPSSALYQEFEWDPDKAAEAHWAETASALIRVHVRYEEVAGLTTKVKVREYVSLSSDRLNGGGYRRLDDVLSNADLMAEMLTDCLRELERLQRKYAHLKELEPIWEAMRKARD